MLAICLSLAFYLLPPYDGIKQDEGAALIQNPADLIERLIALPEETEYIEFKENYSDPEKEGQDICALANSAALHNARAAYKVWGISDSTHTVKGTTFNPRTKKKGNQPLEVWLRRMLSDNAHFEFMQIDYLNKNIVILQIWPAAGHPVRFEGKAYIRTNSSTQLLAPGSSREMELWRKIQNEHFEDLVALEDLTTNEVFERLDYNSYFDLLDLPRPSNLDLALHYFLEDALALMQDDGHISITNLGALLFAKDLSQFSMVRRKALRIIRYDGKGRASDRRERVAQQGYALGLNAAYDYVDGALPSTESVQGARREWHNVFPQTAVRELVVNALIHQDLSVTGAGPMVEIFDNRIEFTNPGTPLVRIDRIVNDPPQSRNESLSALMRRFGYCEEAGSGWDTIIEGCEDYLLPAPRIDASSGTSTRVTLFARKDFRDMAPDERLDACYWHACICYGRGESMNNSTLRTRFGLKSTNSAQVSRLIKDAVKKNLVKPLDPSTSPRYMAYIPYWA